MLSECKRGIKIIADHYGINNQTVKLAEECSEYSASFFKFLGYSHLESSRKAKKYYGRKKKSACIANMKELADVLILAKQIEYLINQPDNTKIKILLDGYMAEKIKRQLIRIEEEKKSA